MPIPDKKLRAMLGDVITGVSDPDLQVQPASIDVRMGRKAVKFDPESDVEGFVDVEDGADDPVYADSASEILVPPEGTLDLEPGQSALAETVEVVDMPSDMVARVEGRSSLGRLFVVVHSTAGYIDPGFRGRVTLEVTNHAPFGVSLRPGMRVAQFVFEEMDGAAEAPYDQRDESKYQGQQGPTASRLGDDPDW